MMIQNLIPRETESGTVVVVQINMMIIQRNREGTVVVQIIIANLGTRVLFTLDEAYIISCFGNGFKQPLFSINLCTQV